MRNMEGEPLIPWTDSEGAFEAWKACSAGRPCDYSGMSYAKLRGSPGIQWPCNYEHPDGRERQYEDGVFNTASEYCETYGHDLATGAAVTAEEHAARDPKGRAVIKGAVYLPPPEEPDDDFPFLLTTGRLTHHFHTRTKTGRAPALDAAAPAAFVELAESDAAKLGIADGDLVEVRSRRGHLVVPARIGGIEPGVAFVPFHYGDDGDDDDATSANRLTITGWDPVSKQPHLKYGAVAIRPAGGRMTETDRTPLAGRRERAASRVTGGRP
jgi:ferredoxin-nitrate reductase